MRDAVALACCTLSGFAALVCEICWIRWSTLIFGSTTLAVSTVVAVFFFGLAVGSWLFGRIGARVDRPLLVYAVVEVVLAALALASPASFALSDRLYGDLYLSVATRPALLALARLAIVALVLLPPTMLMGATLPLFCRWYVRRACDTTAGVARVYALNTLGAAAGCATAGLMLLPTIGIRASLTLAAGLDVAAAVGIALVSRSAESPTGNATASIQPRARQPTISAPAAENRREPRGERSRRAGVDTPAEQRGAAERRSYAIVALLVFASGFVALGNEVLWARFLALVLQNTIHAYTASLTAVLAGIVLGSMLAARLAHSSPSRAVAFGAVHLCGGLLVLVTALAPPAAWRALPSDLAVYVLLLLPPAVLSGAAFPIAVRMMMPDPTAVSRAVGTVTALNTAGGIAGSLVMGFGLLPHLGLALSVRVTTGLSLLIGTAAWLLAENGTPDGTTRRRLAVAAALLVWLALPRIVGTVVPDAFLADDGRLVDYREGIASTVAVVERDGVRALEIDRWWQGQDRKTHQVVAAHLPMLLHAHPRRVLVVGVGTGQTPSRVLLYPIERLDCVDIEPAVFDVVAAHFDAAWMSDPRVRLIRDDGRNFVTHTAERYDVISLELGQIFRPGVASFYTIEFYRRARMRLRPNGLVAQLVALPFFTVDEMRTVIRTFVAAFPVSVLFYNTSELLLVGANGDAIDASRLALSGVDERIADDLAFSYWGGPAEQLRQPDVLLASVLSGPRGLAALAGPGPLASDDRPSLELAAGATRPPGATEPAIVAALGAHLDDVGDVLGTPLPAERRAAIERLRTSNLGDIVASALVRRVQAGRSRNPEELGVVLDEALRWNPRNVLAHRLAGDALVVAGRLSEAEGRYREALAIDGADVRAHRGLAYVLQRADRIPAAIGEYEQALAGDPADAETHNNLGAALAGAGDLRQAAAHFEAALRLRPDYVEAADNLQRLRAIRR